ncbi:phosphohydrolase [Desulfobacter hydrogenophilus]|uniref:HDOD domain-containing protein n=1 Tax=Desulfobacter hydrogenophilus TaxID=2291 RepID=A0A328F8R0_9BACT|nr:HDOD domain-containing protein [Desulfobacter hydrogenophilus]NDY73671.1 HDOD domain-containing protein [Desulfobacter hydrogenophilus]QBH14946.1 HDOD domain-containing protein [Desulfobacter hydrogenophilus]RAM00606.1 phosphohydrolase [Desulfobacter hydrogenophilus]
MTAKEKNQGEQTIANAIALDILNSKVQIPPMPANGPKLMSLIRKSINDIKVDDFVKIIDSDPGLLSMILQLANSAYFKGIDEVYSLRSAIARIGLQETIDSANLYFFRRMLPKLPEIEGFQTQEYWAFSWACANAARRLGHPNIGMNVNPGELYIAGLLHGIGKLILAIQYPFEFTKCIQTAAKLNEPVHMAELNEFGTTDTNIASKLLGIWHIPSRVCTGIEFYQNPALAPEKDRKIAALLEFAYAVASMSGIGKNGDGCVTSLESTWIAGQSGLPLSKKEIQEAVVNEIHASLEEKSESVIGIVPQKQEPVSAPENSVFQHSDITNGKNSMSSKLNPTQGNSSKTGFFSWIRSLFH